jgi:hypothetical protein
MPFDVMAMLGLERYLGMRCFASYDRIPPESPKFPPPGGIEKDVPTPLTLHSSPAFPGSRQERA